uniref:Innexin n=1 Tax=Meloidogyne javanica TaxID=6303 RepID=A0A915N2H1_MELJA
MEEAKRLQETDKEKAEKILAKQQRKEKRRRELALLAVLKERAGEERRCKNFADSVDILILFCRFLTSYAVFHGKVHKMFLPQGEFELARKPYYIDIEMFYGSTLEIDMILHNSYYIYSYCQQIKLCCRLTYCQFVLWVFAFMFFGGFCMFYRMLRVQRLLLDENLCQFKEGVSLKIYEQFYKCNGGKTKAEVELKRVETLRREKRESRRAGTKKEDDSSSSEEENIEIGRPPLYPKLIENEEKAMPNIRLDRQKGAGMNKQDQLEVLITHREPSTIERNGMKKLIPSFLIKKSNSQKRTEKIEEAKRLRERDKEKNEKLLAKQQRKEKKRAELALLREKAKIERRRKNFADSVDLLLTYCRLTTSFAVMVGNVHKMFLPRYLAPPRNSVYDSPDILMVFGFTLLIDVGFFWLLTILR